MLAAVFAAIAAFQVIFFGENPVSLFVIVKVFVFFDAVLIHGLNVTAENFIFV